MTRVERGIYRRGDGQYQAKVQHRRLAHTLSETFRTLDEARKWRTSVLNRVDNTREITARNVGAVRDADTMTVGELVRWYLAEIEYLDELGQRRHRVANGPNIAAQLRYWLKDEASVTVDATRMAIRDIAIRSLTKADLVSWWRVALDRTETRLFANKRNGPDARCATQTVEHRLNALSLAYQAFADKHQIVLHNPTAERGARPGGKLARDRRLRGDEERVILDHAATMHTRPWFRRCLILALETTMRQQELVDLRWSDVELRGTWDNPAPGSHLRVRNAKNPEIIKRIPITPDAFDALRVLKTLAQSYPESYRKAGSVFPFVTTRAIIHAWTDLKLALSTVHRTIDDLNFHDLRREATSRLVEEGMEPFAVIQVTGHRKIDSLHRYVVVDDLKIDDAVQEAFRRRKERRR